MTTLYGRVGQARFAFVSCQRFEHGWFTAYRALRQDDLDLVVHLGDYIYESAIAPTAPRAAAVPDAVAPEAVDLDGYRLRHAPYKTDPDPQAAHAHLPFVAILDNHDAVWDGDPDEPPRDTLARRAAAYQAWWEHMRRRLSRVGNRADELDHSADIARLPPRGARGGVDAVLRGGLGLIPRGQRPRPSRAHTELKASAGARWVPARRRER